MEVFLQGTELVVVRWGRYENSAGYESSSFIAASEDENAYEFEGFKGRWKWLSTSNPFFIEEEAHPNSIFSAPLKAGAEIISKEQLYDFIEEKKVPSEAVRHLETAARDTGIADFKVPQEKVTDKKREHDLLEIKGDK